MKNGSLRASYPTWSSRTAPAHSVAVDRWALRQIQQHVATARIRFQLWDGFELMSPAGPPVATLLIRNRRALYTWLWHPDLFFGEAYMFGAVEVRGDLELMLEDVYRAMPPSRVRHSRENNDIQASSRNVHHHYDLGNDFYALWLDRERLYTCAYFETPDTTLEQAQLAKMDLVCRKLGLTPGERVVEAGCGWGALALFMARHCGVNVTAYNVSREQVAYARARASDEGLSDRVTFVLDDYRSMTQPYDVFVSVGMLEHVGLARYADLGVVIDRVLTPAGRGLLHFIGRNHAEPLNPWIRRRIFPGAYPPTLGEVSDRILEPHDLAVLDVENLRLHYVKTIEHWRRRFLAASRAIETMFDGPFVRAWDLYLAGSQASFATGSMQLFQIVFARGASNAIPWVRPDRVRS